MQKQRDHEMEHQKAHVHSLPTKARAYENDWKIPRADIEISESDAVDISTWGEVLLAKHTSQYVAVYPLVKVKDDTTELQQEIEKIAHLQHPNLVHFIGAVIDAESPPCVITERLDIDLRKAYKQHHFKSCRLSVFLDVAYGLHFLHSQLEPIVHGELSSSRVLLQPVGDSHWRAKISAFRFSKFTGMPTEEPCFLAPELCTTGDHAASDVSEPSVKTDVYSYGMLLCEVTTKEEPSSPPTARWARKTLEKMKIAWPAMNGIFLDCTTADPNGRPSMAQVIKRLHSLDTVVTSV